METHLRDIHPDTRKEPALPSANRPISLVDTIVKFFEKILLSRILGKISGRGLLRDEQF
jgi:hypothetical protein